MVVKNDNEVLSDIELVLPHQVLSECHKLDRNARSFFIAVDKLNLTSTQLTVHKLDDDSVKLRVTVLALGSDSLEQTSCDSHDEIIGVIGAKEDNSIQLPQQPVVDLSDSNSSNHGGDSPASYKKRSLKGRPRVPSAVNSSHLNKHLTAVWGSKRKKSKKVSLPLCDREVNDKTIVPFDIIDNSTALDGENTVNDSNEVAFDSMASTVIILKTVARQSDAEIAQWTNNPVEVAHWSYGNDGLIDVEMEFVDNSAAATLEPTQPVKASRDIAERLKARKKQHVEMSNIINNSGNGTGVSCELCGEIVAGYVQLVQHVNQQHQDCTFVRNYLEEISPLAAAQSAVSLPCTDCGRTFSGQTALAAHKRECHGKGRPESKLGALRRHVKAASDAAHEKPQSGDSLVFNTSKKKSKSARKSVQHEVHDATPNLSDSDVDFAASSSVNACTVCGKEYTARKNLIRHIRLVHGSQKGNADGEKTVGKVKTKTQIDSAKVRTEASRIKSTQASKTARSNDSCNVIAGEDTSELHEFACNHCKTVFGRMTLLVTHMRYCLKANQ